MRYLFTPSLLLVTAICPTGTATAEDLNLAVDLFSDGQATGCDLPPRARDESK